MKRELLDLIVLSATADSNSKFEDEARVARREIESRARLVCNAAGHRFPDRWPSSRGSSSRTTTPTPSRSSGPRSAPPISRASPASATSNSSFRSSWTSRWSRLEGKLVLDAGAGLGRFSEVVLNHGGHVVAVDLSRAIDAAFVNLNERDNIHFLQADIFRLPFRPETFDFVYSWGVLHHTPDPPAAFQELPRLVRPGGKLMTFLYANYNKPYLAVTEFYAGSRSGCRSAFC